MPMLENKQKKVYFTEDDAATLTHRYDATTVLTLLQEVAHYPNYKIDWNELVKKTTTGISNAREYQMLWRHLAYRDSLPENLQDTAEPLDDDSDLECELEALPTISAESTSEAAACVKVMIASRMLSESTPSSSTIEAPLTVKVPVCHPSRTPNERSKPSDLMQVASIIFPVTVQRQTLPTVSSTEGIETKGLVGGNMASKRKRNAWSEEEDMLLRAAVQRRGEGNWATIAKEENFPIKRSPAQYAQRYSILKKKDGSTNSGTNLPSTEEQQATRHSLSLALDMPFPGKTDPARTSFNTSTKSSIVPPCNTTEASKVHGNFVPGQNPSQQALSGSSYLAKSKLILQKSVPKCNPTPDPAIKANTVACSARIVSQSDIVSQHKVAQARNAVDSVPTSSSLTNSTTSAGLCNKPKAHLNVSDDVRTGSSVVPAAIPVHSAVAVTSPASCTSTVKSASSSLKNSPTTLSILSKQDKHVTHVVNEVPKRQELTPTEESRVSAPSPTPKERRVQGDETPAFTTGNHHMPVHSSLNKERQDLDQDESINLLLNKGGETATISEEILKDKPVSQIATDSNLDKGSRDLDKDKSTNSPINSEYHSTINGSSEKQNMNEKQANLSSIVQDEFSQGLELPS